MTNHSYEISHYNSCVFSLIAPSCTTEIRPPVIRRVSHRLYWARQQHRRKTLPVTVFSEGRHWARQRLTTILIYTYDIILRKSSICKELFCRDDSPVITHHCVLRSSMLSINVIRLVSESLHRPRAMGIKGFGCAF